MKRFLNPNVFKINQEPVLDANHLATPLPDGFVHPSTRPPGSGGLATGGREPQAVRGDTSGVKVGDGRSMGLASMPVWGPGTREWTSLDLRKGRGVPKGTPQFLRWLG